MALNNPNLDEFFKRSPFLSYIKTKEMSMQEATGIWPPSKKKQKPKLIDLALQELEGMGFNTKAIATSAVQLLYSKEWEVRVAIISPHLGKITKLENIDRSTISITASRDRSIVWIWKEAKKKLVEGKFI